MLDKIKSIGGKLFFYCLISVNALLWLWALFIGTRGWDDPVSSYVLLTDVPLFMLPFSIAAPILKRKAEKNGQAFCAALISFIAFIPWLVFVGGKYTVGVMTL